ncbi:MAG: hypothetical protein U1U88_001463 [Lawsonella clevelandensis]
MFDGDNLCWDNGFIGRLTVPTSTRVLKRVNRAVRIAARKARVAQSFQATIRRR